MSMTHKESEDTMGHLLCKFCSASIGLKTALDTQESMGLGSHCYLGKGWESQTIDSIK